METVKNKVVIITGASSGIGAATAKLLVKNGAKVVLGARREDRLRSLSESLGDAAVWARANVVSAEEFYGPRRTPLLLPRRRNRKHCPAHTPPRCFPSNRNGVD